MSATTIVIVAGGALLALTWLFLVAVLRSHAEILRRLHALENRLGSDGFTLGDEPEARVDPRAAYARSAGAQAPDIVGETLAGDVVKLALGPGAPRTLLAFLSTGCSVCGSLWEELRTGGPVAPGLRIVVVTKGSDRESPHPPGTDRAGTGGARHVERRVERLRRRLDAALRARRFRRAAHRRPRRRDELVADPLAARRRASPTRGCTTRAPPPSARRVPSRRSRPPGSGLITPASTPPAATESRMTESQFAVVACVLAAVGAMRATWSPCGQSMLASLTPVGERGRGFSWRVTATAYAIGATGGGALTGLALGATGSLLPAAARAGAGRRCSPRCWQHSRSTRPRCAVDCCGRAARSTKTGWRATAGWVYGFGFGARLGVGFTTLVACAAVYATFLSELLSGSAAAGALIGADLRSGEGACSAAGRDRP